MATKKTPGTAIVAVDWEARRAGSKALKMVQSLGSGNRFGKKGGVLTFNGTALPGNEFAGIIIGSMVEHVYYSSTFDPDNPEAPTCFALGEDPATMVPHQILVDAGLAQNDKCQGCKWNQFGTGTKADGTYTKSKACKNGMRLAVIAAGTFGANGKFIPAKDPGHFSASPIGKLSLAVGDTKNFRDYATKVDGTMRRPVEGVITKIKLVPDQKYQQLLTFTAVTTVADEVWSQLESRLSEAEILVNEPYNLPEDKPEPEPAPKRGRTQKAVAPAQAPADAPRRGRPPAAVPAPAAPAATSPGRAGRY